MEDKIIQIDDVKSSLPDGFKLRILESGLQIDLPNIESEGTLDLDFLKKLFWPKELR